MVCVKLGEPQPWTATDKKQCLKCLISSFDTLTHTAIHHPREKHRETMKPDKPDPIRTPEPSGFPAAGISRKPPGGSKKQLVQWQTVLSKWCTPNPNSRVFTKQIEDVHSCQMRFVWQLGDFWCTCWSREVPIRYILVSSWNHAQSTSACSNKYRDCSFQTLFIYS